MRRKSASGPAVLAMLLAAAGLMAGCGWLANQHKNDDDLKQALQARERQQAQQPQRFVVPEASSAVAAPSAANPASQENSAKPANPATPATPTTPAISTTPAVAYAAPTEAATTAAPGSTATAAGAALVDAPSAAAPGNGDLVSLYSQGVRIKKLGNGLVLITKENHAAGVVSVYATVLAGSLYEREYINSGISHLTEHLVAGGSTANRPESEIEKTLREIGAVSNAYTSHDQTAYFIDTIPQHVDTAIDLVADYLMNAKIDQTEFEREFGVVQREILNGESEAGRQAYYLLGTSLFPHLPQGARVIGYYHNIQKLKRDDVWTYYKRMYVPSNTVFCVAGDFDGAKVMAKLEAALGQWAGPQAPPVNLPEPAPPVSNLVATHDMDTKLSHVMISWPSVQLSSPDLYALDVLAGVLGSGDSSRLAAELKIAKGLVYGIDASNYTPSWPGGQFTVSFVCDPDKVDTVRPAVMSLMSGIVSRPPSVEEVAKIRRQVMAGLVMGNRTASAQARSLSTDQLHLGDPYFSARYAQNIGAVTAADVVRVARQYLLGRNHVTAIVRPKAAEAVAGARTEAALKATVTKTVLPESGLTLLVYRTPGQPAVGMIAAMKAGQTFETAENAGISAMAAEYLTRGTKARSEEQIADFFDAIGASINASSGWNAIYVQSVALKSDFAKAFDVFADVVMNPSFAPNLLPSTQQRQIAGLRATMSDAFGDGGLYFGQQFFTNSPYRFPGSGTEETVGRMTADGVKSFYLDHRVGRNMVLAVAGDVDPAEVEKMAAAAFKELPAGQSFATPAGLAPRKVEELEIYVKKTDKPSCVVMIGYPGIDIVNLRDRFAMEMFGTIAAGYSMPSGWLHETLRGQSLVYAVFFNGRPGLLPGYYRSVALCQPEKATKVARLLMDLIYSGRDFNYTEDELRRARSTILTSRTMAQQTPEEMGQSMALNELLGMGHDFDEKYGERLQAVTIDEMRRAVKAYINAPVICIVTPQPELVDMKELRLPYDAKRLEELRALSPKLPPAQRHSTPAER